MGSCATIVDATEIPLKKTAGVRKETVRVKLRLNLDNMCRRIYFSLVKCCEKNILNKIIINGMPFG